MPRHHLTRRIIIICWLLFAALCFTLYSLYWRQSQINLHTRQHEQIRNYIGQLQIRADGALESFAALQSKVDLPKDEQLRKFAQLLLKRNPHIYCLQVMQRVPHEQLPQIESLMREAGYRNFQVHDFDYANKRSVKPLSYRKTHYPIIFMEPLPEKAMDVLGLDIEAVNFLASNRQNSGDSISALSTGPFKLIEGDVAYGMTLPVFHFETNGTHREWPVFVGLVIKAAELVPPQKMLADNWELEVRYKGAPTTAQTVLFRHPSHTQSQFNDRLFPTIEQESELPSPSQPYVLHTKEQLNWSSWQGPIPFMLSISLLLLLALLLRWQQGERMKQISQRRHHNQLQRWASKDPLTHLANRQTFDARIENTLQQRKPFALLYLDLNDFKPINDTLGHAAGDYVLKVVAQRLKQAVRTHDLVTRWGGDEFAILLDNLSDETRIQELSRQIKSNIQQEMSWQSHRLSVSISIGHARYPQEATDLTSLMHIADQRMYQQKQSQKQAIPA